MAVLPLVSVVYVSTATTVFTSKDLAELLRYARDRNSREGISGMLLYRSGNFIQAVEGPPPAIDDLLARIGRESVTTASSRCCASRRRGATLPTGRWDSAISPIRE